MQRRKVLVVGGGIAGLAAATELAKANCEVVLLEAQDRLGGRIFTIHSGETPIELGAEFIHGGNNEFWKEIREAKLETIQVPNHFQLLENGNFQQMNLWQEMEKLMEKIDTNARDKSSAEFLAGQNVPDLTKRLAINFIEGFDAADTNKIGVQGLAVAGEDEEGDPGEHQFRINRGYSALVEFFEQQAKTLGVKFEISAIVKTIEWKSGVVKIIAEQNGKEIVLDGNAAIVAVSLGVLKSGKIKFQPPLPKKERAIAKLEFGNVVKIILKFKTAFWPERNFGFIVAIDEAIPTWWSDSRGIILTGWAGGPKADALSQKSEKDLKAEALKILAKIFKVETKFIEEQLLEFHWHDWRKNKFIGGAYSYVPVNGLDSVKQLASPVEETLFFAGEATASDTQPGTVHGALSSGLRAAKETLQSFGD
jgi:monoamine oxidase